MTPSTSARTTEQAERRPASPRSRRTTARPTPTKKDAVTSRTSTRTSSSTASSAKAAKRPGQVSFVGTGPGDPGLLTVRAVELIRAAEVVVTEVPEHAALVASLRGTAGIGNGNGNGIGNGDGHGDANPPVLVDGAVADGGTPLTLAARGKLVVKQARGGAHVVRLLAGDPFVHGSAPEEAQACRKAGIGVEVVPGVPESIAVPAYAGVPLTCRGTDQVTVLRIGRQTIDWSAHGGTGTLVLLSALDHLAAIAPALVAAGRDPGTPVAVTYSGTTTDQATLVSTLDEVAADVAAARVASAAVVVIGSVVGLRDTLSWFETRPLFGWRVLVPRTKEQAGELAARLRTYGAMPEEVPTISVEPPRNPQQMDKAVRGLVEGRYEWVGFTSVNAVKAVREKFDEYGLDSRAFSGLKIAAVGEATAAAIGTWGIKPDLVPSGEQSAAGLLEDWPPFDDVLDPINRVFLPRADIATETLVAGLVELGWEVDDVTAYRTVRAAPPPAPTREAIKAGRFDAVVFTSSSTVRNLVGIAGKPHPSTVIACIGPATAKTAEEHGLRVDVLAESPSSQVLADALADFGAQRRLAFLEAGEPVTKPSEKRPAARRRAT